MSEWLPIESAPKDKAILVCAQYSDGSGQGVYCAEWSDYFECFHPQYADCQVIGDEDCPVTHWMPLPAPPLTTAPSPASQPSGK